MPSHLTALIRDQFDNLDRHHRRHRLLHRWSNEPALAGRTANEILELCRQATPEQNPAIASLLRLHQTGDPDAGTVLLTALRPMLLAVVRFRHPHITDELIDNYWTAASHLLGAVDPDMDPVDRDGRPSSFITHLGNRLHQNLRDLEPDARRWHDRRRRGELPIPLDFTRRSSQLLDRDGRRECPTVEDIALARIELTDVADAVRNGTIAADRWHQLVEHRLGANATPATGADRVAIHRTASRLAALVGHAA